MIAVAAVGWRCLTLPIATLTGLQYRIRLPCDKYYYILHIEEHTICLSGMASLTILYNAICCWSQMFLWSWAVLCWRENVLLCTANKRLDIEASALLSICMLTGYVCKSIFILIVNVLHLHFQGQRIKSNNWEVHTWLYQTFRQIWEALLYPINRKSHMAFRLSYLHFTLGHYKGQGHAYYFEG